MRNRDIKTCSLLDVLKDTVCVVLVAMNCFSLLFFMSSLNRRIDALTLSVLMASHLLFLTHIVYAISSL